MKPLYLEATTISDAWFRLLYLIPDNTYIQNIQQGSFENEQYRRQFPGVSIYIEHPELDMVPIIPAGLGIPAPTSKEYIDDYFANYIMDPILAENETYKYASRINQKMPFDLPKKIFNEKGSQNYGTQLDVVIKMLKETPLTNQAVLEIATPTDIVGCVGNDGKLDPPCLRLIDFKVIPKQYGEDGYGFPNTDLYLTVSVYFRSWDLWAGFPTNLGGIELLKQYVASECNLINGPMYAYSSGLHVYKYQEEIRKIRTGQQK